MKMIVTGCFAVVLGLTMGAGAPDSVKDEQTDPKSAQNLAEEPSESQVHAADESTALDELAERRAQVLQRHREERQIRKITQQLFDQAAAAQPAPAPQRFGILYANPAPHKTFIMPNAVPDRGMRYTMPEKDAPPNAGDILRSRQESPWVMVRPDQDAFVLVLEDDPSEEEPQVQLVLDTEEGPAKADSKAESATKEPAK
jgi:hypothetical protein